jgi:cytochrome c
MAWGVSRMRVFLLIIFAVFALLPITACADPIHEAAKKGDLAAIASALDAGADVNAPDKLAGPLFYAVQNGHLDAAKLLIDRGADVNAMSKIGLPLSVAALRSYPDLISLLLAHGADPNTSVKTQTPLHMAAAGGCLACVKALVEAGADVNAHWVQEYAEGPTIRTPYHLAKFYDHPDVAAYLLQHGVVIPRPAPISAKLPDADAKKGQAFFQSYCSPCHATKPGEARGGGPGLWGVVGRVKASAKFDGYSPTLRAWGGPWTYEDLNTYLAGPPLTVPGVFMEVAGAPDEGVRADLIVYLRTLSDKPMPLP